MAKNKKDVEKKKLVDPKADSFTMYPSVDGTESEYIDENGDKHIKSFNLYEESSPNEDKDEVDVALDEMGTSEIENAEYDDDLEDTDEDDDESDDEENEEDEE